MPTAPPTLDDLKTTAATAAGNVTAAQKRIDDAKTEVRAAALEHYQTIMGSLQPAPPAKPSASKAKTATAAVAALPVPTLDALEQRVRKALADLQQVCRDLGV